MTAATLGQELASALRQVDGWISNPENDDDLNIKDESKLQAFGQRLKKALLEVWKDPTSDVFDIGYVFFFVRFLHVFEPKIPDSSQEEVLRVDALAEEIGTIQSLRNSFNPILGIILMALDAPAIFMRTKALRALGQIVTSDASILSAVNFIVFSLCFPLIDWIDVGKCSTWH